MNVLILAAGTGRRLAPLTDEIPKCMVNLNGVPIIDYNLQNLAQGGVQKVTLVTGYRGDVLQSYLEAKSTKLALSFLENKEYLNTNMSHSLMLALHAIDEEADIIISYSDIVFNHEIIKKLSLAMGDFCVVVDEKWRDLWEKRMSNPIEDVESLRIQSGEIVEIGQNVDNLNEVQGQYIGLIKISTKGRQRLEFVFKELVKAHGEDVAKNMYLTDLIQKYIELFGGVKPVFTDGGWLEVDSVADLDAYQNYTHGFRL